MKKRIDVVYSGNVQGIGFRFSINDIARALPIGGWVKNEPDGTVRIVAEGEEGRLKDFIDQICVAFPGYINDSKISWEPGTGEFKDFGIKY